MHGTGVKVKFVKIFSFFNLLTTQSPKFHMVLKTQARYLEAPNPYSHDHTIPKDNISFRKQRFVVIGVPCLITLMWGGEGKVDLVVMKSKSGRSQVTKIRKIGLNDGLLISFLNLRQQNKWFGKCLYLFIQQVAKKLLLVQTSWLHRASNNVETFLLPTDAHNVKKHRVIKTF